MSWDWQMGVTGDPAIRVRLSPKQQIQDLLRVEGAFARALGAVEAVPREISQRAADAIEAAQLDMLRLAEDAAADGMPVPSLVRQLKDILESDLHPALHAGLTSQDVMDTALMLAVAECLSIFDTHLRQLVAHLERISEEVGDQDLMARTRMQAALPISLKHRLNSWRVPLERHLADLARVHECICVVQMGGPVGTGDSFPAPVEALRHAFAAELGVSAVEAWHTDRGRIMELGGWLARVSGSLSKMGGDIALMSQQGVDEVALTSGGRSSAMAHKKNPVRAEVLIALGRDVSVQLGALHLAQEHEQERSGTAWTLEWLVLPRMLEATGAGLLRAIELLEQLSFPERKLDL